MPAHDQQHRYGYERPRHQHAAHAEGAGLTVREQPCQCEDHCDLGEFRGLQADPADAYPGARTLDTGTKQQDADQQQHDGAPDEVGVVGEVAIVERPDDDRQGEPGGNPDALTLSEIQILALRCRGDENHADHQ